jgi:hypothetical protein
VLRREEKRREEKRREEHIFFCAEKRREEEKRREKRREEHSRAGMETLALQEPWPGFRNPSLRHFSSPSLCCFFHSMPFG